MSEHSTPQPAHPDGTTHVPAMDLITGDPPVPITVWRTARSNNDHPGISRRLAYRLVAAYSRPDDAVVDLTDTHLLTTACRRGRRRHHPAWFTGDPALVIGPATPHHPDTSDDPNTDGPDEAPAWFGDDLTDGDPAPADNPPHALDGGGDDLQGRTSLVVATWPLDASSDTANRVRLAWLLAACTRLLRPGGCLVLVVVPAGTIATPEDFTPVVDAAASAGLGYLQHIVAVTADTDGDRFTYHATDEELLSLARATGAEQIVLHVKVHADLLVFTTPPGGDRHA
ncbi:hypothetical protein [Verrucosispora sp. WMMC514]|uniref:hypothetical protein n=1 Tax=Verrucosispora sp. WMMC514 TaxID=3015156 RepID=UPI00248C25CE|nr:hypothetical protein [Verrucosispora sp. WMMC514]WBB93384.1 hypothetical protein O7597_10600 [Verrucosispora sp. WMMC514]